jgi:hypothetical protein
MSLITVVIVVVVIGVIAFFIKQSPIDQLWKNICYGLMALFLIVWLLMQMKKAGVDIVL